jgi:hypothetical protein
VGDFFEGLVEVMERDEGKETDLEHFGLDNMNRLLVSIAKRKSGLDASRLVMSRMVYDAFGINGTLSSVLQFSRPRLPRSLDRRLMLLRLVKE